MRKIKPLVEVIKGGPLIEITQDLSDEGIERLSEDQLLIFKDDKGKKTELKIIKLDKENHRAWATEITTFSPDEASEAGMIKKEVEKIKKIVRSKPWVNTRSKKKINLQKLKKRKSSIG